MVNITTEQIKKLREKTQAPVMECRTALREAQGKPEKALEILRKKGLERADKKASREVKAGLVESYTHTNGRVGVLVELLCETDFVARNEEFKKLAHELCLQVASMAPKNIEDLLAQEYIREPQKRVQDLLKETIGKLGENIVIRRFERFELGW